MRRLMGVLVVLMMMSYSALAITRTGSVFASGNVVYGTADLSIANGEMPGVGHKLILWCKITSPTWRTTGWISKTTLNNNPDSLTIPMSLGSDYGAWVFEVQYNVVCPKGSLTSVVTKSFWFTFGHSNNCLFIIPNTQQVISYAGVKMWYALYQPAVGCTANCVVDSPYGSKSAYTPGSAPPAYINMQYNWVYLNFLGWRYCLDAYQRGNNPCTSANCGDSTGF